METKEFATADVLSVVSGRLMANIGGVERQPNGYVSQPPQPTANTYVNCSA